ncbi:type III secretion system effector protein XopU [Paracidovorax citrulli]|uniref:Type III secretion system effector protein XopU n=1 Tax=Paracidovorax citrulli TaxID=80869 RepID=A0ABY9AQ52_PARCI|nr:type III secretion system effector protein XopU [Paracidovorax citrulli]WIY29360.1 type III secretion system effector protein XopU [Paracidovorax citrulli]WIY38579.1 type III secretion system effector protein XopU [Paracidovorax citrulli]WIY44195.1 type III secretion system effector protein XopU [Paracidovorax citrulli]WIY48917.1 type III secretion system effector protein XopU [Paracidovorax citrulli]
MSGPSMDALRRALPARATASGARRRHAGVLPPRAVLPFHVPQPPCISSAMLENPAAPHAADHEDGSDESDFQVIADDGPAARVAAQRTAFIARAVEQAGSERDISAMVRLADAAASQAAALQRLPGTADVIRALGGYRVPPEFQQLHRRLLDAAIAWRAAGEQYGAAQAIFRKLHPGADADDARIHAAQAACEAAERQLLARHQVLGAARRSRFHPALNSRLQADIQAHLVQCLRQACDYVDADAAAGPGTPPRYELDIVLCRELAGMTRAAALRLEHLQTGAMSVPEFPELPAADRELRQKEWTSRFTADAEALEAMARRLRAAWGDVLPDTLPETQAAADALRAAPSKAVRAPAWREASLRRSFGLLLDSLGPLRSQAESAAAESGLLPGLRQLERLRRLCNLLHTAASLPRVLERSLDQWTAAEREGSAATVATLRERATAQAQAHEREAQALLDEAFLALWQSGAALLGAAGRSGFPGEVPALDLSQLASWARAAGALLKALPLPAAAEGIGGAEGRLPKETRLQGFFALANACELLGPPPAGTLPAMQRAERLRAVARSALAAAQGAMAEPLRTLARQCDAAHVRCLSAAVRTHAADVSRLFAQSRPTLEEAADRLGAELLQGWDFAFMPALVPEGEAAQATVTHAHSADGAPAESGLLESLRSIAREVDALHRPSIPRPQEMPPEDVQAHLGAKATLDAMACAARASCTLLALWQEIPSLLLPASVSSRTSRAAEFAQRAISVDLDAPAPAAEHAAGTDAKSALSLAREVRRRGLQMNTALKVMQHVFQARSNALQRVQDLRRLSPAKLNSKVEAIQSPFASAARLVSDREAALQSEIQGDESERARSERQRLTDWCAMLDWRMRLESMLVVSRIYAAVQNKEIEGAVPGSRLALGLQMNRTTLHELVTQLTDQNKTALQLQPLRENRPLMGAALGASLAAIRQLKDCDERTQALALPGKPGAGGSRAGAGGSKQGGQRRGAP